MVQARANQEEFDLFSLDDVDEAFAHITKVTYYQGITLPGMKPPLGRICCLNCCSATLFYLRLLTLNAELSCLCRVVMSDWQVQHLPLTHDGIGTGIQISAYPAGHMIGGSVWQITKDDEDIIYAVDYNHRRERHLKSVQQQSP